MSYIPADVYSNLAYLGLILAMGVLPLLPTVTVAAVMVAVAAAIITAATATVQAVTVAATMILAATATLQAVLLGRRCQRQQHLRQLLLQALLQALHHTALLPMAPAPRAGAAVVAITTVCNVSSLLVFIYPS